MRRPGPATRCAHRIGDRRLETAVRRGAHEPEAAGGPRPWSSRSGGMRRAARSHPLGRGSTAPSFGHLGARTDGHRVVGDRHRRLLSGSQHRGFGGVAGAKLVVPSAVAVAGGLDDLAVAGTRRSATACGRSRCARRSEISSCSSRKPSAVGTTRSIRDVTSQPSLSLRSCAWITSRPWSWNRQNGGHRSKKTSGLRIWSGSSHVSKVRLKAAARRSTRPCRGRAGQV